jgi:hypothetical protein
MDEETELSSLNGEAVPTLSELLFELPERQQFRCLDPTHVPGCSLCSAPPDARTQEEYELVGDPGKRNGEKRLRSLLARTPEWLSRTERERLASECGAERLAKALRERQASSLRKSDLFELCRLWSYRSGVWLRRRDRRARPRAPAAESKLPAAAAACRPPPAASGALQLVLAAAPGTQLQPVHVQLAELRRLAEVSIASFADAKQGRTMLAAVTSGRALPPLAASVLDSAAQFASAQLDQALGELQALTLRLRQQHAELQVSLLRLQPAQRVAPAWQVLSGHPAPWSALLLDLGRLADFAVQCGKRHPDGALALLECAGEPTQEALAAAAGGDLVLQAQLAVACGSSCATGRGGAFALELLALLDAILSTQKLAAYEQYLNAASLGAPMTPIAPAQRAEADA